MIVALVQFRDHLIDGIRSALFLKPSANAFNGGLRMALALCALHLVATLALTFVSWRGQVWLNAAGLSGDIATYAVGLALLAVVPFAASGLTAGRVFVAIVATALPCVLVATAIIAGFDLAFGDDASTTPFAVMWLTFIWVQVALFKLVLSLAEKASWRTAAAAGVASLIAAYALPYRSVLMGYGGEAQPSLLQAALELLEPPPVAAKGPVRPRLDVEAILHDQPALLDGKLADLKPSDPTRPNLYFVGVAPYANQDVFRREVNSVKTLFDTRFGTSGRSLLLINHRDDVFKHPLASVSNLEVVLRRLGALMQRDKDVLVLFVTSHGTRGEVNVKFPYFPLNDMTAERLARVLEKSRIRNRVLIFSACHSGSLIPTLRSDHTLILTAAHADKTSFGCSNENEWTYFGDAYFNRALRREASFIAAFDAAKATIAGWEKRDGLPSSDPQMFVGDHIRSKLDALPAPATSTAAQ